MTSGYADGVLDEYEVGLRFVGGRECASDKVKGKFCKYVKIRKICYRTRSFLAVTVRAQRKRLSQSYVRNPMRQPLKCVVIEFDSPTASHYNHAGRDSATWSKIGCVLGCRRHPFVACGPNVLSLLGLYVVEEQSSYDTDRED